MRSKPDPFELELLQAYEASKLKPAASKAELQCLRAGARATAHDLAELTRLEEAMWRAETRFDPAFQEAHFAVDFVEFGRSGRTYTRAQIMRSDKSAIQAKLPLPELTIRMLGDGIAQLTYNSEALFDGVVEHARRSSIWTKTETGCWVMRFHQGTPYEPAA